MSRTITLLLVISIIIVPQATSQEIKLSWSYRTGDVVWSVAVSSDGGYVAAGSWDNKVYFFSRSGRLLWSYETGGWVRSVAVSSDGGYVAAGSYDSKVYLFSTVVNRPPVAGFSYSPASPTSVDVVRFYDQSYDPDGRVVRWLWEFGDGASSTEQNPVHRYADDGCYTVRLTVWDDKGAKASVSRAIVVRNVRPEAAFAVRPERPYEGQEVVFDASQSHDPDGSIAKYEWDLDGDGRADARGVVVRHVYDRPGAYRVRLTVIDDDGARAVAEKAITVLRRALPDLTVRASVPLSVTEFSTLRVSFRVSNVGSASSEGFRVSLFIDRTPVDEVSVEGLEVNSSFEGFLTWKVPSAGEYELAVCADPEDVVEELDEGNNCFSASVRVLPAPKLEVEGPEEVRLLAGEECVVEMGVRNVGSVAAKDVNISFSCSENLELLTPSEEVGTLRPGDEARVFLRLRARSSGSGGVEVVVTAREMPTLREYIPVVVERPLPNLEARLLVPGVAEEGYPVNATVVALNRGGAGSGPFMVSIYLDGELYDYRYVKGVEVDGREVVSFTLHDLGVGQHEVRACLDTLDEVPESNETDNCARAMVRVRRVPPRLKIVGFYAPYSVVKGREFVILLVVENTGSLTAEDVEARLILPPGLDFAGRERPYKYLGSIPPRKSAEEVWTLKGLRAGDYIVTVRITAKNATDVQESLKLRVLRPAVLRMYVEITDLEGRRVSRVKVGDVFRLTAIVSNGGEEGLEDITVSLDLSQAEGVRLAPKERLLRKVGYLEGGRSQQLSWLLEAVKPGRSWVSIIASSGALEDHEVVVVEVGE